VGDDDSSEKTLAFSNQTNSWLRIKGQIEGEETTVRLAPFERRVLGREVVASFDLEKLKAFEELEVQEIPPIDIDSFGGVVGVCFFLFILVGAVLAEPLGTLAWGAAAVLPAIVLIGFAAYAIQRGDLKAVFGSFASVIGWFRQQINLLIVVAIGAGIPAAAIYYGADLRGTIDRLVSPPPGADLKLETYTLVGRLLQFAFISTVSLLPALLYFLFDREQLQTIREQFVRHIFRLDGTLRTRKHMAAKYGLLMDEALGRQRAGSRVLPGRRSPLFVATFVIALGWLLTLLNADVGPIGTTRGLLAVFTPHQSALTFAFLGAYFFALNTIVRGYVRKDLRPKSYSTITVRILAVMILAWVLELSLDADSAYLLTLVFVAGIVPETAFVYMQELLRRGRGSFRQAELVEAHPLTNLEGIDIYDRARLSDEGVTNVEALAHHDLIELMLYTRIPPARLVDWVDQAILYLHVGDLPVEGNGQDKTRLRSLAILRARGIRTATDLERAWDAEKISRKRSRALLNILAPNDAVEQRLPRLRVVLDVLEEAEWMGALRHWRSHADRHASETVLEAPARESVATADEPTPAQEPPSESEAPEPAIQPGLPAPG
jgi:hypothetical protein